MQIPEFEFPETTEDIIFHLQQSRAYLNEALTEKYSAPPPGRWSRDEILYHLVLSEQSIIRAFQKLLSAQADKPSRPTTIMRAQWELMHNGLLDRKQTMSAPERVQPLQTPSFGEIQDMMQATRDAHYALLRSTSYQALDAIAFPHGKLGELSGLVWSSLVAHHELRHTQQLVELRTTAL